MWFWKHHGAVFLHRAMGHGSALPHALSCRVCITLRARILRGGSMQHHPHPPLPTSPSQAANRSRAERLFWELSAQGAWRPVPICALQNGCRGGSTAQIVTQEFRRCCLHSKQGEQGLATAGHSPQGAVGTPISLRQSQAPLPRAKSSDRTAVGPWTRSEQGGHQKTQPISGSWAHCKLPASEEWVYHFQRPATAGLHLTSAH